MHNRTHVLIAIALLILSGFNANSRSYFQASDNTIESLAPRQSLAQFFFDMYTINGIESGLDTLDKYANSPKFYLSSNEIYNAMHLIYRSERTAEADLLLNKIRTHIPKLNQSMTQIIFEVMLKNGAEKGVEWLAQNRYDSKYYSSVFELDRATRTFMELKKYDEAKVMAELYKAEDLNDEDAYYILAEIALVAGDEELAMQHLRDGMNRNDHITFMTLAGSPLTKYIPTVLPKDTTLLFKSEGNLESDTAFVFIQGGPMPALSAYRPRPLTLLPDQENTLRVDVLQAQMINQTILSADPILTNEQCLFEHNQNAEMMHRTIEYLKNKGKTVFVIGHSYGCYISLEYLKSKKNLADKLILMGADLDENPENYALNEDGSRKFIRWRNGVEPYEKDFWRGFPLLSLLKPKMQKIFTNTGNLVASHAKRKFTELLKGKDLSNVVFYHARYDESNARTTQKELDFLESHGAITLESCGDHHSMLSPAYIENIYEYLAKGKPLKRSVASTIAEYSKTMPIDQAIDKFKENKSDAFFDIEEAEINLLGYEWLRKEKLSDALKIFQFNVDHFPHSWNVYDSLAETHLSLGSNTLARIFYQSSLDIHPGNSYAIQALESLR